MARYPEFETPPNTGYVGPEDALATWLAEQFRASTTTEPLTDAQLNQVGGLIEALYPHFVRATYGELTPDASQDFMETWYVAAKDWTSSEGIPMRQTENALLTFPRVAKLLQTLLVLNDWHLVNLTLDQNDPDAYLMLLANDEGETLSIHSEGDWRAFSVRTEAAAEAEAHEWTHEAARRENEEEGSHHTGGTRTDRTIEHEGPKIAPPDEELLP